MGHLTERVKERKKNGLCRVDANYSWTAYILGMKVRDVIKLIEADGWYHVRTRGSHRQFKHPTKPGKVTVAGKPSLDLPPGTLNSIMKQSGLND